MANSLDIFRGNTKIATIDIDESTVFNAKLPGTELITCPIDTLQVLKLREEDYIIYQSAVYKIRILPDASKDSTKLAKSYNINFLARFYDLHDTYVQHLGSHVFPYYGTASDHLALLLGSANLNDTGWIAGAVDNTTPILLDYNWTFIRPALDMIAEAFGLEWNAVGTTVNMKASIGNNTGLTFELGRGKGLHQINRASDTSKEKINRVYGVGGTRNIDATYRNGEETNLVFQERYVETPGVTAGTERVREGKYENLDIYPHFEGVVANPQFTIVGGVITSATIQDLNIDFDLMLYLQDGVKPKVSFLTGPVTGVDFEISAFNFSTKTVTLIPFTDTSGYYFPSATSKPDIGDKFTFIDVRMPSAYIATWEAKLKTATIKFLNENKSQRINFSVELDEKHLRDNNIVLKVGDIGTAIDADLDANEIVRFTEISYPIVNEFEVKGVIGNEIVYDKVAKLFADVLNNTKQIATVSAKGIVQAKRSAQDLRSLEGSIFDTEGMFDTGKFNVGVLTAVLGIFGVKSQNFVLSDVRMVDNVGGNPNAVTISGGQLIHLEITNAGAGGDTWNLTSSSLSSLLSSSFYYIYAKCSKVSQVGSWVITTDQIKPDDVPGFYHFLAGVIYPVNNGFRDSEFTYGITDITGNRIKTGVISGRNGALVINLETGEITGTLTFKSASGTYLPVSGVATTANNALNNASVVSGNLSSLQANLGGLAYENAVQEAMESEGMIIGGYFKNTLIDTQAIIVSGGLATQSYAQGVATSAGANALSNATALVNNLQIGARNYQINSEIKTTNGYANVQNISSVAIQNGSELRFKGTNNGYLSAPALAEALPLNQIVTLSMWIANFSGTIPMSFRVSANGNSAPLSYNLAANQGWTKISVTFLISDATSAPLAGLLFEGYVSGVQVFDIAIKQIKLERGNKVTDWSPAPEDVSSNAINLANSAQVAAQIYAASQSAFEREVAKSYADGKVSAEELARINQASANLADAKADSQAKFLSAVTSANGYTDTKSIATISAAQTYADSVSTTKANAAVISATSAASADAQNKANAAQSNAVSQSASLINSLSIGAVNLQPNGRISSLTGFIVAQNISSNFIENGNEMRIIGTNAGYLYFPPLTDSVAITQTVTLSLEVQNYSASTGVQINISSNGNSSGFSYNIVQNLGWTKVSQTFLVSNTTASPLAGLLLECYGSTYNFAIRKIKLERGTKATDWSPAISDVDSSIALAKSTADAAQSAYSTLTGALKGAAYVDIDYAASQGVTAIKNGNVVTFKVEAAYIKSNIVTADYIQGLEVVAPSLRTANSGTKRFEATQATNSAILYSASNQELVRIDDNLAIERYTLSGPIRGPGIRVGQENANSASLSRYGLSVVQNDVGKQFIGQSSLDGSGIVRLDASGEMVIRGLNDPSSGTTRNVRLYLNYMSDSFGGQVLGLAAEII